MSLCSRPLVLLTCLLLGNTCIDGSHPHANAAAAQTRVSRIRQADRALSAGRVSVNNLEELRRACESLSPGTILEIRSGTYELSDRLTIKARGTEERPVVIRSSKPGGARIRGEGGIYVEHASHVTLDGLTFKSTRGLRCQHSDHVRITNCRFELKRSGARNHWIGFDDSRHVRIDHCEFGERDESGSYIHISRGNRYFRIDHNYFHDYRQLGPNGGESIYLHGTGVWAIFATVEHNLFERCNGEGELIGIKSHRNIIRGNTFKDCKGAVSIRDGNHNSVYNNVFLAFDEPRAAGVRIHGKHNAFANNYLYGIYKPIECCWGDTDAPHRENLTGHGSVTKLAFAYRASYDNLVAHNTLVNCGTVFQWTKKRIPLEHVRQKMGMVERNGPFLAKLWEEETSQYRDGDFVEPKHAPKRWYVLNNVILNTPQLVRIVLARGTAPPVREEEFRWRGNLAFWNDGRFDMGVDRRLKDDELRFGNPGLMEEEPGVFRAAATNVRRREASVDMDSIRPYVDRPEIAAALENASDFGANRWKIVTIADVGPRTAPKRDAGSQ